MEKILCPGCCAPLTPNSAQPFFTCEYCGTTTPNTWYDAATAKAAAEPTLDEECVATLRQMGQDEKLASVDEGCFGTPLDLAEDVRTALEVPQQENVYLLYERYSLLGGLTEGFVLADTGMYYLNDGETGRRSWESFVTGAISGTEDPGIFANGTLSIGTGLTFAVASSDDARIARFVIDLHNRLYTAHTGQNAPASWRFATQEETLSATDADSSRSSTSSVAKTVLGAAATLLAGGSILSGARRTTNTILHPQRHTRPVVQPVIPTQPARRAPVRPSMNLRPGASHPGTISRPATGRPAMPARPSTNARPALNRTGPNSRPGMSDRPGGRSPGGRGPGGHSGPGGRGRR